MRRSVNVKPSFVKFAQILLSEGCETVIVINFDTPDIMLHWYVTPTYRSEAKPK
jgi:hypothetical protein